ncbi:MAG: hypothetical protein HY370_09100 [Proteobacteria bacterium]|nr:hypothetical protein [Pseudomonadota bacterium]
MSDGDSGGNNKKKIIKGHLHAWFETGTEGIVWVVNEDRPLTENESPYDLMHILEQKQGALLTVFNCSSERLPVWKGKVDFEYRTNIHEAPTGYKQQAVFNRWVHGLQKGLPAEAWAVMFFAELPATLEYNS